MAIEGISDVAGVITFDRLVVVKGDLKVDTDLNITGNVSISGDLLMEDTLTEDAPTVKKTFGLFIPEVSLGAATKNYTVAPCNLTILSMHAAENVSAGANVNLTVKVAAVAEPELLNLVITAGAVGRVHSLIFVTAPTAVLGDAISVYSDAAGIGTVNVTLICEAT